MHRPLPIFLISALALLLAPGQASAHWCNNIWAAPSRIVVKPEVTTVNVGGSGAKLRIYVRNNLPYTLFAVEMRGNAGGYTVSVSPAQQDIHPGQNRAFTFSISGPGGKVGVDTLGLQMKFRPSGYPSGWLDESNQCMLNQKVDKATITKGVDGWWKYYGPCGVANQSTSLNAATLHDMDPKAKLPSSSPFLGRTGAAQLIKFFGYRFCYNGSGSWRCGSQECPSPCAEGSAWGNTNQFPQNCMRAGVELAVRKAKLGSLLAAARAGAENALKGGCGLVRQPTEHKCLAAVVGAHLLQGGGSSASFTATIKASANCVPKACQDAALRILTGAPKSTCSGLSSYEEEAACAAAEGLRGNDAPVKSILLPKSGDGYQPSAARGYGGLFYSYMLHIVTAARMASQGKVSYYPDAGAPLLGGGADAGAKGDGPGQTGDGPTAGKDSALPGADSGGTKGDGDDGCSCGVGGGRGGAGATALLLLLGLLLARRRG